MSKIKPILPSLREKKRYIVFEVVANKKFNFNTVAEKIQEQNLKFLGELGCAKAGAFILDTYKNNKGIIRVNNKYVDEVKSALTLIEDIDNQKVIVKTIYVSGLLRKAKEKF